MPLWQQCSEASLPYFRDYSKESFHHSHNQLQLIRHDLNRARLIVDRVRRREKLKKDLICCANDHLLQNILQAPNTNTTEFPLRLAASSEEATDPSGSVMNRLHGSLSLVSEGAMSSDSLCAQLARKRGRPRRLFPTAPNDKKSIRTVNVISNHENGKLPSSVPIMVKYVQGRDKNGKFLKKAPIIIGAGSSSNSQNNSFNRQMSSVSSQIVSKNTFPPPPSTIPQLPSTIPAADIHETRKNGNNNGSEIKNGNPTLSTNRKNEFRRKSQCDG